MAHVFTYTFNAPTTRISPQIYEISLGRTHWPVELRPKTLILYRSQSAYTSMLFSNRRTQPLYMPAGIWSSKRRKKNNARIRQINIYECYDDDDDSFCTKVATNVWGRCGREGGLVVALTQSVFSCRLDKNAANT